MDDATRLISELQAQLAELDHKVTTYRQDLADGFLRHSRQLLSDLDPSLSARVQDALAHCLGSYPAISPALITGSAADLEAPIFGTAALVTGSPALTFQAPGPLGALANPDIHLNTFDSTNSIATTASAAAAPVAAASPSADHEGSPPTSRFPRSSTPPSLPPSSTALPPPSQSVGATDSMSDSPDDREAELRGVFTPTYLPLSTNHKPSDNGRRRSSFRRCRGHHSLLDLANFSPTLLASLPTSAAIDAEILSAASSSPASIHLPTRPSTTRRATDDVSTSSVLSDKSDSKSRRSALRRSSSSSKPQSPGGLQDVRQQPGTSNLYTIPVLREDPDHSTATLSAAVILGLSDLEENEGPRPKSTVWIPVTQDPDPEADEGDVIIPPVALTKAKNSLTSLRDAERAKRGPDRVRMLLGAPAQQLDRQEEVDEEEQDGQEDDADDDSSSDDDFLSMGRSRAPRPRDPAGPAVQDSPSTLVGIRYWREYFGGGGIVEAEA
ncbi:unnamed protein product [Parascedosporium putredinis]|uniref:Uncharacterized protein n=1 Tax=Parascedosporium putredinis TaxID=1442378 RepID=A0A9P1HCG6_9PEZI|nr:unnamed protein product [Parascedosporium putredinis]CAI8003835.1 unnamed protein product [Parascedosporium putredinis]